MKTTMLMLMIAITTASCKKVDPSDLSVQVTGSINPAELTISELPVEGVKNIKAVQTTLVPNGGGVGTSDWTGRDIADGWSKDYPRIEHPSNCRIIRGQCPFTGVTQYIENVQQFSLYSPVVNLPYGRYNLTFYYCCNCEVYVLVRYNRACGYRIGTLQPTNGVAEFRGSFSSNVTQVMFYNRTTGGSLQIDQINLTR